MLILLLEYLNWKLYFQLKNIKSINVFSSFSDKKIGRGKGQNNDSSDEEETQSKHLFFTLFKSSLHECNHDLFPKEYLLVLGDFGVT